MIQDKICQAEVQKNIVLVELGKELTLPLAILNRSCQFRKVWERVSGGSIGQVCNPMKKHHKMTREDEKAYQKSDKYKAYGKAYNQRPEVKAYRKAYYQRPEVKAYRKAYNQRPEVKAYGKAYNQRPEVKAYGKAYNQRPEVKAYKKAYYLKHKGEKK